MHAHSQSIGMPHPLSMAFLVITHIQYLCHFNRLDCLYNITLQFQDLVVFVIIAIFSMNIEASSSNNIFSMYSSYLRDQGE